MTRLIDTTLSGPAYSHGRRWVSPGAQSFHLAAVSALAVFIYVFIQHLLGSLSNWRAQTASLCAPLLPPVGYFNMARWRPTATPLSSVFFIGFSLTLGLTLAIPARCGCSPQRLSQQFLFPMPSFVVTGVVWRWIFNPETGSTCSSTCWESTLCWNRPASVHSNRAGSPIRL
jgi:glucose/mannose transport system permease protein